MPREHPVLKLEQVAVGTLSFMVFRMNSSRLFLPSVQFPKMMCLEGALPGPPKMSLLLPSAAGREAWLARLCSPRGWGSAASCFPFASHPDCSCLLPAAQPFCAACLSLPLCLLCFSSTACWGDIILCLYIQVPNGRFSFVALVTFETTALNRNSITCENL